MTVALIIFVTSAVIFGFVVLFGAPFVPTRKTWAQAALNLAKIKSSDTVVDLGSGTGIILKLSVAAGARAIGYELNPLLVLFSKIRLIRYGNKTDVKMANFWKLDLPLDTTVVYVFSIQRDDKKLIKYLHDQAVKLKTKKLRVVSFGLPLHGEKPVAKSSGANLYMF